MASVRIQHSTFDIQHSPFFSCMEILFTPWRYPYLTSPKSESPGCIFCIAAQSEHPRETHTLYRNDRGLVMLNRYPYTNGHLMVAPIAHEARLFDSSNDSLRVLIRLTAEAQRILSDVYRPDGFNVGMNFMTVTASTRLVPEELHVTFDKLQPHFDAIRKDVFAN